MTTEASALEQNEQEINDIINKASETPTAEAPAAPGEPGTPAGTPPEPPQPKAEDSPKPGEPPAPPDKGDDKLLAGKFKTVDELKTSVNELAEKLGYPKFMLKGIGDDAKELEDVHGELYAKWTKQQETENQRKQAEEAQKHEREQAPAQPSEAERAEAMRQRTTFRNTEIVRKIRENEELLQRFQRREIPFPFRGGLTGEQLQAEMEQLRETDEYLHDLTVKALKEHAGEVDDILKQFDEANSRSQTLRKTESDNSRKSIKELGAKLGLKFSDEEINGFIKQALDAKDSPLVYKEELDVPIPRESGITKYFLAEILPTKIDKIVAELEARGRVAQAEAIKKLGDKVIDTPSSANIPGAQQRAKPHKKTAADFEKATSLAEVDEGLEDLLNNPR